jgi:PAS domain S-box-containing protein
MAAEQSRSVVFLAIPIIAGGIFVIGSFTPPGIVNGVWYFIPLLLSIYVGGRFLPFLVAALLSVLIIAGYFLSPMGLDFPQAIEGHFMSVFVLWVGALLISQHKRAVGEIRLSEERFRSSMQNSGIGMTMVAPDGQWLEVNPAFCTIVGYTQKELLATNFQSITHPDDLGADLDHVRQMLSRQIETYQMEKRYIHKDGHTIWIQLNVSLIWGAEGKPRHFVSQVQDITKRKQAEAALVTEQRLLNSLIAATPDSIYFKDRESRFIRTNEGLSRRLGLSDPRVLLGKTDFDFFGEQHARQAYEDEQRIITTGQPMIDKEEREDWTDGRVAWVSSTKMPLRDSTGKIVGIMGISRDITERKNAEAQIRDQARLLDLAPDAILVRDLEDRILYWNKSATRIYGWTAPEAIGKKVTDLLHKDVFNFAKYEEARKTVLEKGEWHGEFVTRTKDRQEVFVEARWTLIRDVQGNPKSILGISTDITEKKKFETQLFRSQRMESLGTLAGGIAHDLNNVLSPLLISVQVLKGKITDDDGKKLLDALETNVLRGASLVKQVLAFGRGVTGERILIQPKHIAREIKQFIHETFPKSVEFELHTPAAPWTLIGDPTQLHQVLLNLCVNARDAMPEGGKLSIHLENVTFDEVYAGMNLEAKAGPYVCIKVSDTGTGIPKEIQDKIFDPFFTTKEPGKGTGLGLSTTLAIVKSHGGFINCHSEPGKGCTFKVYFPANTTALAAETPAEEEAELPRGHNELVMVVDDEKPICQMAKKMLERFGYRVLLAADGTEAVSLYATRRNEIGVVITDIAMPNMDGFATIGALKAINAGVKIVGSSGYASGASLTRINDAGIRYFVPKPYTAETMLNTLQEILHGKSTNQSTDYADLFWRK